VFTQKRLFKVPRTLGGFRTANIINESEEDKRWNPLLFNVISF
jgi:hypothetical protein